MKTTIYFVEKLEELKELAVSECLYGEASEIRDCIGKLKQYQKEKFVPVSQLPVGMEDCTIEYRQCSFGHGRLIAKNWVDHGCTTCVINSLTKTISELTEIKSKNE